MCGFGFHFPPLVVQKLNPKYFVLVGLVTLLFSAFTFKPSFFSIYFVIELNTLFAAFSLLTSIIQSSAYLTKFNPLASSSLSNSFNIILLSNGLKFPPCGVPFGVGFTTPFSITPALRYFLINDTTSPSFIVFLIIVINLS